MRVRANANAVVVFHGKPRTIAEGQEVDESDAVVKDYPWLFESPEPKRSRRQKVERATAAPGELRDFTTG